jgi:hypothetical protein
LTGNYSQKEPDKETLSGSANFWILGFLEYLRSCWVVPGLPSRAIPARLQFGD